MHSNFNNKKISKNKKKKKKKKKKKNVASNEWTSNWGDDTHEAPGARQRLSLLELEVRFVWLALPPNKP